MPGWLTAEMLTRLRGGPWFASLSPALAEALLDAAHLKRLQGGETLFMRGAPADGLYAVLEGSLRISGMTVDGKEAILSIVEAPQWLGEIALFDGMPRTHDVVAEAPSRLLHVPRLALEALLAREPVWWRDMGRLMAMKVRLAFIGMEDLSLYPAEVRLARRLLLLVQSSVTDPSGRPPVLPLSQTQLGMMLSLSRQTTNQILQGLQQQGILQVAYGRIELRDLARLAEVAELDGMDRGLMAQVLPGNPEYQTKP